MSDYINKILNFKTKILDKNGNIHIVSINIIKDESIKIVSKNEFEKSTGYANIYFHPNKRIFLDTIYCYQEFRGLGIASSISKIIDYVLNEYDGYIIRGCYEPSQLSTDRLEIQTCSSEELEKRAFNFYNSCGYHLLSINDFIREKNLITDLTLNDDFQLCEELSNCIVFKKIKKTKFYI